VAAAGSTNAPRAIAVGAGERAAATWPNRCESIRLSLIALQVDDDEDGLAARPLASVDRGARGEILAGLPDSPLDQHGRVGSADAILEHRETGSRHRHALARPSRRSDRASARRQRDSPSAAENPHRVAPELHRWHPKDHDLFRSGCPCPRQVPLSKPRFLDPDSPSGHRRELGHAGEIPADPRSTRSHRRACGRADRPPAGRPEARSLPRRPGPGTLKHGRIGGAVPAPGFVVGRRARPWITGPPIEGHMHSLTRRPPGYRVLAGVWNDPGRRECGGADGCSAAGWQP